MKTAFVAFRDDAHTYVICPYCTCVHRHGVAEAGQQLNSHCFKGEYTIGGNFDFAGVLTAVSRRERDMERKRALRKAARELEEAKVWPRAE